MRVLPLLVLAVLLARPAAAQPGDPVEQLAQALALTADQADLVAEVYDARDPASTWTLAAELVPTLSADQRQALLARPERPADDRAQNDRAQNDRARGDRARGDRARGDRARGGQSRRARGPRDPAQQAVLRAARDAALGLDADHSARLDAALDGLDRRERMQALRDGEMPPAVADVLTAEQAELWQAQRMLQRRLRAPRPSPDTL